MDALRIIGGSTLSGNLHVSGSKNASLPIMAAALLADGTSKLHGVPNLVDVKTLSAVLHEMGAEVLRHEGTVTIAAGAVDKPVAPYELVRTMRASFLVLGPLLARFGRARVSLPGGCAIGARPVDQHLKGLERLGARIEIEHGYVLAEASHGLVGAEFTFDLPTVTGTENLMLAAARAKGTTVLRNCACEPEIVDLAHVLVRMGAQVAGAGTEHIEITGSASLAPYDYRVMPDRIECGTFLVAGALAGEDLRVIGGEPAHQEALIAKLREAGAEIVVDGSEMTVQRVLRPRPVDVDTSPYPGFPTDMQAQLMVLMCLANGESVIKETIFENRFMHVAELGRLGAAIRLESAGKAIVDGVERLSGTTVMATDLRASACLVLAGLVAQGETVVRRIYHLDRGYDAIDQKLCQVGARIERFKEVR